MIKRLLRTTPLLLSICLTACASLPSQMPPRPVVRMAPKISIDTVAPSRPGAPVQASGPTDGWGQLRSSFAMSDCDADPAIMVWARRYARNPRQFENQMDDVLPRLVYVQGVAAQYDVAGEFVLLPWVESRFQTMPGHRNRPAGIWQIMPATAVSMGLRVNTHYDGRLDVSASAHAVMKLLKAYHDQFHDWRVADYAYNAGEFRIRQLVQTRGTPADAPVIPRWPVQKVTREHLARLLAIACIVREPGRFNVSLPSLSKDQQLVQVSLARSMPVAQAAHHAGMSIDTLRELNAGFRNDSIDVDAAPYLLLPASHVDQFRAALSSQPFHQTGIDVNAGIAVSTSAAATSHPVAIAMPVSPIRKTHRVKHGESLWQIAHRYSVGVTQLQRWNHLRGGSLKPGQILQLSDAD